MSAPPAERLSLPGRVEPLPVEVFRPAGEGPWPAVVVLSELWGLNDDLRRIASRLAEEGFLAFAPDLWRGRHYLRCLWSAFLGLRRGAGPLVEDLEALAAAVRARPDVSGLGVIGFCLGGGYALLIASRTGAGAAGVFYGEIAPAVDLDRVPPTVGGYGGQDPRFERHGRRLVRELAARGTPCDVAFYPRAGHSFLNDAGHPILAALSFPVMQVGHDPEAAADAWARMVPFLRRHLGPGA